MREFELDRVYQEERDKFEMINWCSLKNSWKVKMSLGICWVMLGFWVLPTLCQGGLVMNGLQELIPLLPRLCCCHGQADGGGGPGLGWLWRGDCRFESGQLDLLQADQCSDQVRTYNDERCCRGCVTACLFVRHSSVGTFFNGAPHVCGGVPSQRACYVYDRHLNSWNQSLTMSSPRELAAGSIISSIIMNGCIIEYVNPAGVMISEDQWWIMGGTVDGKNWVNTTERMTSGGVSSYLDLPLESYYPTAVRIDNRTLFINPKTTKEWGDHRSSHTFAYVSSTSDIGLGLLTLSMKSSLQCLTCFDSGCHHRLEWFDIRTEVDTWLWLVR